VFDRCENIEPVKMHAEVCLLLLGQHFENLPASCTAIDAVVGEGLGEDNVNNLFS
jgi:hypothetical protein